MKLSHSLCIALLASASWAGSAAAQGTTEAQPQPQAPSQRGGSGQDQRNVAGRGAAGAGVGPASGSGAAAAAFGGLGSSGGTNNYAVTATMTAGKGPGPGVPTPAPATTTTTSPLILPGLFTASQAQAALPLDRVFFNYGFFEGFAIRNSQPPEAFNLNIFNVGVEKTFFDGRASVYVQVPLLDATDNTSGQPINGLGDITAGLKAALLMDQDTGSALTAGFTISAPTGRASILTTTTSTQDMAVGSSTPQTTRINPTYLQPWTAGLLVLGPFFVQDYFGVIIPTDQQVPVFLNNNLIVGYQVYQGPSDALLTSLTPFVGAQELIPVSGRGDQVFLQAGIGILLHQKCLLSGSYITPVAGPRAFEGGMTAGINFFF